MKLTGEEDEDTLRSEAKEIVLRQLSMMDRTRHELMRALTKRNVPENIAEQTVDRYEEHGLVNDEAFANRFVATRMASKPSSRRGLAAALARKGIERELIETALEQVGDEEEDLAALELAQNKARMTQGLDRQVRYRRIYGALARRGFSPPQCRRAVEQVLGED
ncbi:MAG: regulatory protein RecX [Flaviflexus sp.]|nr:regulatory protein RecX [Flaviflexus sp.]